MHDPTTSRDKHFLKKSNGHCKRACSAPLQLSDSRLLLFVHAVFLLAVAVRSLKSDSDASLSMVLAARPCFSLMEGPPLVQQFRSIILLASLAYTFTNLHAIQYSMQNHDDSAESTTQNQQDNDSSALLSTRDTLATTSTTETAEKASGRWTDQEVYLLLDFVEQNSILTTARGLNLKKSEFNRARDKVKSKDAAQCHYKWGRVSTTFLINEDPDCLSIIIAMCYLQGNFALGQEIWQRLA